MDTYLLHINYHDIGNVILRKYAVNGQPLTAIFMATITNLLSLLGKSKKTFA